MDVLIEMLTNEPAGRLYKALVETKKRRSNMVSRYDSKIPVMRISRAEMLQGKSLDEAETHCSIPSLDSHKCAHQRRS